VKHRSSPPGRRPRRVAEQVRQVVTAFLTEEARDPRIGLVTVTNVEITRDLTRATVSYVVHGDADQREKTQEGLEAAAVAVRRRLGSELQLRVVPEVVFKLDTGSEHMAHIARLLAGLDRPGEPPS
jgi:ribosome-binding factor A